MAHTSWIQVLPISNTYCISTCTQYYNAILRMGEREQRLPWFFCGYRWSKLTIRLLTGLLTVHRQMANMRPQEFYQITHGKLALDRLSLIAAEVLETWLSPSLTGQCENPLERKLSWQISRFSGMRLVVQERGEMVPIAETNVKARLNPNLVDGTVVVEAHDFFTSQPRTGDDYTFMLRHVLCATPSAWSFTIY